MPAAIAADDVVRLRPFRRDDLPRLIAWRGDAEIRHTALWGNARFGPREAERWLRSLGLDRSRLTLAIELRPSARLVGLTVLNRVDRQAGTAYFGIVVGEKDCWGRGVARQALGLMLRRATAMGLRKVLLEVAADNPRALRLYRGMGFQVEGVLRSQLVRAEGFVDLIVMAIFLS